MPLEDGAPGARREARVGCSRARRRPERPEEGKAPTTWAR